MAGVTHWKHLPKDSRVPLFYEAPARPVPPDCSESYSAPVGEKRIEKKTRCGMVRADPVTWRFADRGMVFNLRK